MKKEVAPMNGFRVGNLFGIPLYVHPSWFFILGLVTFSYGSALAQAFPGLGGSLPWLLGLVAALLLFASVLAHELGHSFVALQQGINVKSITLFLFGGLAHLEEESKTPAEAFWVAIAGPLVSFALFGIFTAIGVSTGISGAPAAIVTLVASINLVLGVFNLIPGLPLDGGNILKAIVWKITGNPYKGVVFASRAGQILAWIAIISGLVFRQFWNVLIGGFLLANAGRSAQYATLQNKLAGLTVADAVTLHSPIVSERLSLRDFVNNYIIGKPSRLKFLVTNDFGKLLGAIAVDDLKTVPTNLWPHTQVRELTQPVELSTTVKPHQSLLEVVGLLETQKLTELPVIRDNGEVVGLVERDEIIRLIQGAQAKPV
jgi:Zn-dependent protease